MSNRINQILNDYTITKDGKIYDKEGVEINTFINSCGYVAAVLNGYIVTVAYIVAKLYVENPTNSICIAYKDNDYTNINADNLVWYYEGEEQIEDKSVIAVNEEGEIVEYYNTVKDCAKEYDCQEQNIITKCNGRLTMSDDYYFFFEENYTEEELTKRKTEKENLIKKKKQKESARLQSRTKKWAESCRRSNSLQIVELNSNGEIVEEYSSITAFMNRYNICYLTADKIIKQTGTINDNYVIYRKNYETISDIKLYIERINKIKQIAEAEKERKRKQQEELKEQKRKEELEKILQKRAEKERKRLERRAEKERKRKQQEELKEQKRKEELEKILQKRAEKERKRLERRAEKERKRKQLIAEREQQIMANNVLMFDYNGNLLNEFQNYRKASLSLEITDTTVRRICKGKLKQRKEYYLILREYYNEETIKGMINNTETKDDLRVLMFDYNGNLIREFENAADASKELNISAVTIGEICKGSGKSKQRKEYYLIYGEDYDKATISDTIKKAERVIDKRVVKLDINGKFIRLYNTATEAGNDLGYSSTSIAKICTGEMKQRKDYYLLYNEYYNEEKVKELISK